MKTAFLDSSVLFSAVNSITGGSSKLFTLKKIRLVTSTTVLAEVERNVRKKLESYHLDRFFMLVDKMVILNQIPIIRQIEKAKKVIAIKDAVILSEGKTSKANYMVTLDQKHFLTDSVEQYLKPKQAFTPKQLIELLKEKLSY